MAWCCRGWYFRRASSTKKNRRSFCRFQSETEQQVGGGGAKTNMSVGQLRTITSTPTVVRVRSRFVAPLPFYLSLTSHPSRPGPFPALPAPLFRAPSVISVERRRTAAVTHTDSSMIVLPDRGETSTPLTLLIYTQRTDMSLVVCTSSQLRLPPLASSRSPSEQTSPSPYVLDGACCFFLNQKMTKNIYILRIHILSFE